MPEPTNAEILSAVAGLRTAVINLGENTDATLTVMAANILKISTEQASLRVALMARMDRLQDAMLTLKADTAGGHER